MPQLINISVVTNPHLNNEDIKNNLVKRNWSMVTEVEIESDHLQLNFEQKNELRQLIMDAIKKVTSPVDSGETDLLVAQQIHTYLFDLYDKTNHGLKFPVWLGKTIPRLGGLGTIIERGQVFSYSTDILQDLADNAGLTLEQFLDHIEQIWNVKTKR